MQRSAPLKLFFLIITSITFGLLSQAHAASDIVEPESTDPATLPVMVPGKAETADSAFAKLDTGKKGYLTREDTNVFDDFDKAFNGADEDHDDRLTPKEFINGWSSYTGIPSNPETFQRIK